MGTIKWKKVKKWFLQNVTYYLEIPEMVAQQASEHQVHLHKTEQIWSVCSKEAIAGLHNPHFC